MARLRQGMRVNVGRATARVGPPDLRAMEEIEHRPAWRDGMSENMGRPAGEPNRVSFRRCAATAVRRQNGYWSDTSDGQRDGYCYPFLTNTTHEEVEHA